MREDEGKDYWVRTTSIGGMTTTFYSQNYGTAALPLIRKSPYSFQSNNYYRTLTLVSFNTAGLLANVKIANIWASAV